MNKPDPTADPLEVTHLTPDNMTSEQHALLLNTPTKAVKSFLTAWQFGMYKAMFTATQRTW